MCELANQPPALTWKEFRSIREKWETDSKPMALADLVTKHADRRAVSVDDVDSELFQAMLRERNRLLEERGRFIGIKYCLFKPDSPVWKTNLRDEIIALARSGRDDSLVYSNVSDLFDLMVQGLRGDINSTMDKPDVVALVANQEFVSALWNTVTSKPIQYRMQMSFVEARTLLIQSGVPEDMLPLTDELKLRAEENRRSGNP